MPKFDNVSVVKKANVYFDGKCVSHTVYLPDGVRKSVGVILPSTLTFTTAEPERMEIVSGVCRVKLPGDRDLAHLPRRRQLRRPGQCQL